jgi:magnesium transporter
MDEQRVQQPAPRSGKVRVLLFDAQGKDRPADNLQQLEIGGLGEHELVWIDVHAHDRHDVESVFQALGLHAPEISPLFDSDAGPLSIQGDWFAARAVAACWDDEVPKISASPWLLVVGPNVVVTAHKGSVVFLDTLHEHHDPDSRVGELDAESFAVVLLDRMLTTYFDSLDAFEGHLDKLEIDILANRIHDGHVPHLRELRRSASIFRRLLSSHRDLFDALRRPDFNPDRDDRVSGRFGAVAERYERAMDAVENARELVVGSYELLETRLSQRTNETMRLLTFATVLLGSLAVIAGVLGMNFQADLFSSGSAGFWATVGAMAAIIVVAIVVARWRRWWK